MSRLFSIFYIFFSVLPFINPLSAHQNEGNTKEVIPISTPEQISSHYKSSDFLIGDVVNPLSGSPSLSNTDLIAKGAQSINLTRYYNPPYMPYRFLSDPDWNEEKLYEYIRNVYKGWRIFSHCELTPTYNDGSKIITKISEPSGLTLEYEISKGQTKLIGNQYGISNIQNDNPSGKYDFRNTKVTISGNGHKIIVLAADGTKRYYNSVNNIRYNFCLEKEILPNGKVIRYNYNGNRLLSIDSMDPKERFVYATISLHSISDLSKKYSSSCQKECFYNNDQRIFEKEIIYTKKVMGFDTKGSHSNKFLSPHILTAVISPFYKNESITYDKKFLMDKYLGKDLVFTCEYAPFQGSDYHFRIKKLCLPVGADGSFSPVYDINYDPAIAGKKTGVTSVKNINGTITKYCITKNLQIGAIQDFDIEGSLKKEKAYTWLNNGWLSSIELKDGNGKIFYKKTYKYDGLGNPIEEIFTGDLKGNGKIDSYTIVRKFSQEGLNLLLEEKKEDGLLTTYQYLSGTNLITEKYTQDNDCILLREFYEYDDSNNLIKKIEDDGSSLDKYDLQTVSQRTITKYNLRQAQPFLHMIESIEEKCLQNGIEKLFKRTCLTYDKWGNVSKEDIYDANNSYSHSINKTYNERGDLLSETNPLKDKATFEYDDKGREKQSVNYSHKLTTNKEYDTKGRLKKIIKTGSDGIIHINSNEYDESDNLIQKIDRFGNSTRFEYDLITGNVKTKTNPPVLSIDDTSLDVITNSTYNALGLETSFTDAKGYITKYQYNAYGSLIEIIHPNEAKETFRYNKNSKLQSYVDQEGVETRYDYDILGRVISKSYYFDNNKIANENFKYDSYHLIEKSDKEEGATNYSYDGWGRKIFENFQGRETTFQYDNLGRLNLICKENRDNTLYINYERDLLDRITKETKTGKTGKVLYEIAYTYDKDGNRESIIRNINDKQPIETFAFDSFGREIEHKDGAGNFTKTQYIENFINPINQKVLQIKKTDPKNIKTVLTYDVFSNPTNKNILDAHEAILSSVDSRYDTNRNLIETKDLIYEQNNHKKTITTRYTYTENNLVENLIRAYGSEDEKKTVYDYTSSGRLKLKDLPIGTQLQYSYDHLGNLNKINSNDKKVNQTFKYNKLGFLLKAEDKIQQTKIERKIDSFGNILKETFNDNLVIDKQY
nr:putative deoxyribonuclease RhsA [Candidatus Anoxychlamydiales bacterium]